MENLIFANSKNVDKGLALRTLVKTQLPERGKMIIPWQSNLSRLNKTINNEILKDNYMPLRSGVMHRESI